MGKKVTEKTADNKEVRLDYKLNGTVVTITAHTGESNSTYTADDVINSATFDANDFPSSFSTGSEDVTKTFAGYGLLKVAQDRTSQVKGAAGKIEAMIAELNRMKTDGTWSALKEREASAPRAPKVDAFLAAAIAELKGITTAAASAALAALSKEQRVSLASNPAVTAIVDRLKAEAKDASASVADLGDLLG